MNYIKPEDIKEYVSKNPTGIAGMSEELTVMVNHFAELIVKECAKVADLADENECEWIGGNILAHFGVR